MTISYDEFEKVDLRSGTVVKAENFPKAKKPAYKVYAHRVRLAFLPFTIKKLHRSIHHQIKTTINDRTYKQHYRSLSNAIITNVVKNKGIFTVMGANGKAQ